MDDRELKKIIQGAYLFSTKTIRELESDLQYREHIPYVAGAIAAALVTAALQHEGTTGIRRILSDHIRGGGDDS